ncbi:Uncharacterised protein [Chryseobacterium carnipullorum]|uniref:Uncharacterized protein n=1 Tax=Chryseobacterium carnipullorum TaxID=1124835 RepID=A0A376DPA1_CHRCU|nr:Uncharacterised protein [Chryseobacterium carnipullorum]
MEKLAAKQTVDPLLFRTYKLTKKNHQIRFIYNYSLFCL